MKREILVFSGTGNSLAVANGLAGIFGDCEPGFIPGALQGGGPAASAPFVGLVYPLYSFGLPRVVLEFLRNIDLSRVSYLFAGVTRWGSPGARQRLLPHFLNEFHRAVLGAVREAAGGDRVQSGREVPTDRTYRRSGGKEGVLGALSPPRSAPSLMYGLRKGSRYGYTGASCASRACTSARRPTLSMGGAPGASAGAAIPG